MSTLRVDEENYREFVETISDARQDWIDAVGDGAITIMERQRYLLGMSIKTYYTEFLGCKMNYRTIRDVVDRTSPVPTELMLSFCFTYGYDIKRFLEVSELIKQGRSFDHYQQIGASIEALGKEGIYQLAESVFKNCTDANLYNRRRCSETLQAFADGLREGHEDTDALRVKNAAKKIVRKAEKATLNIRAESKKLADTIETVEYNIPQK